MTKPVDVVSDKRFSVSQGGDTLKIPYSGNISLSSSDNSVERAIVVVPGSSRTAPDQLDYIMDAADRAGEDHTAIIAPQFLIEEDVDDQDLAGNILYWDNEGWKGGDQSERSDAGQPFSISSFEVVNRILLRLADADAYPDIEEIVVAGHSGGGQFVNRYAAGGTAQDDARSDISWKYVVANPSTYMYFSEERAVPGETDEFEVPNSNVYRNYNDYKYGLDDLNPYMDSIGAAKLRSNFQEREVAMLLGEDDNDPNHPDLATGYKAELEGENRLDRGVIYFNHLQEEFGSGILARHSLDIVPDVAHWARGMFRSEAGLEHLFGDLGSGSANGDTRDNILKGGSGDNYIEGGSGDDALYGEGGDDTMSGGLGQDTLDGGSGSDTADYSYSSSDRLRVDLSKQTAWFVDDPTSSPGSGNNPSTTEVVKSVENVIGSSGDNFIIGNSNRNNLEGGAGDDTLMGGYGTDKFDGDSGSDTVDYSYSSSDRLRVDLSKETAWFVGDPSRSAGSGNQPSTTEELKSIENVIGTRGDNVIIGDSGSNVIDGSRGVDTITGGGGNDLFVLRAGDGADIIRDYNDSHDGFLLDGLSYSSLDFVDTGQDTEIQIDSTNQVLAILEGVDDSVLHSSDFDML